MKSRKLTFTTLFLCLTLLITLFPTNALAAKQGKVPAQKTTVTNTSSTSSDSSTTNAATETTVTTTDSITDAANAYFVSLTGNDANPGTLNKPWRTIQKAADTVQPGNTVYIRGGVYNESSRIKLRTSGTDGNYITFSNYPGETVTIDGAGVKWSYYWDCLFDLQSKSYIKITGLRIINSHYIGIGSVPDTLGCQHIIIQNCSTYNTKGPGIAVYHGKDITIDNNSVEMGCTGTVSTQENISLSDIDTFAITNNHVFNCTNNIPGAGGEGIDVKNGCANGVISYNLVNDVYKVGIYIDAYGKHQYNIEVFGNKVYNTTSGIAVAVEKSGLLENVNIYNNLVYNCIYWGLTVGGWGNDVYQTHEMNNISFSNNTVTNAKSGCLYLNNPDAKNVYIANNIFNTTGSPIYVNGGNLAETTIENNLFNKTVSNQPTGTAYIVGNPQFASASSSNFHLLATSPAIDKGTITFLPATDLDNTSRDQSVDIGCYEF